MNEAALKNILKTSQTYNTAHEITGLLLYAEGNFIQVIEGPKQHIEQLFTRIKQDPRHHRILVLVRKHIDHRDFPEFRMGFHTVSLKELSAEFPAFTDIVVKRKLPESDMNHLSKRVATFLRAFARTTEFEPSLRTSHTAPPTD